MLEETKIARSVITVNIEEEIKQSYLDYAMSVIVGRALPDARDGLKPVHRRILFAMHDLGNEYNKPYKKSARIVGDVIGKYHPHGDTAVYDAIVRMAQDFSLRSLLIDGQGNFGSVDGDPPAAMRYTEVRMKQLASEMLADIEKETVDFVPNYDGSLKEPAILPARFPNLLANGSAGIAVGMATNIPPHNLGEVIDATIYTMEHTTDWNWHDLLQIMPGPDFPTGGYIYGRSEIVNAFKTGRGSVIMRGKVDVEAMKGDREAIIITELPYQVNKSEMIKKIAELVREKRIEGVSDIRDESDKDGIRVVIELKRDVPSVLVINQLYKYTALQSTFGVNMIALVKGQPRLLNVKELLDEFILHRKDVVTRRTKHELSEARKKAHILEGLKKAVDNLDLTIQIIRGATDPKDAKRGLMERLALSDAQAQAILDMKLQRLTGLELDKIVDDYNAIIKLIADLEDILRSEKRISSIIKTELTEIRKKYADKRRTEIRDEESEVMREDLIKQEDVVVTLTYRGFIKRTPRSEYPTQHRGGKGRVGISFKEDDFLRDIFICSTHDTLLLFTSMGRLYALKTYDLPEAGRNAYGKIITSIVELKPGEKVTNIMAVKSFDTEEKLFFATKDGHIKRTALREYINVRKKGIIAINIEEHDTLVGVALIEDGNDIILSTRRGKSIRFHAADARQMGRSARGVTGIRLDKDDSVVGLDVIKDDNGNILTVTTRGFGKQTSVSEYRMQKRGGKGILTVKLTAKNGEVAGVLQVGKDDKLLLIASSGKIINIDVETVKKCGRGTQGVILHRVEGDETIVGVAPQKSEVGEDQTAEEQPPLM